MSWLADALNQVAEGAEVVADHAMFVARQEDESRGDCSTCGSEGSVPFRGWVPASRSEPGYWLRDDLECVVCTALANPRASAHLTSTHVCYCTDTRHAPIWGVAR